MIRVELQNGTALLFREYEKVNVVDWISDDGEYWAGWKMLRADKLEPGCYVIERIGEFDEAIVEKDWISPVRSGRKFVPDREFF